MERRIKWRAAAGERERNSSRSTSAFSCNRAIDGGGIVHKFVLAMRRRIDIDQATRRKKARAPKSFGRRCRRFPAAVVIGASVVCRCGPGLAVVGSAAKDEGLRVSTPFPFLAFELGNAAFGLRVAETKITNEAPSVWNL